MKTLRIRALLAVLAGLIGAQLLAADFQTITVRVQGVYDDDDKLVDVTLADEKGTEYKVAGQKKAVMKLVGKSAKVTGKVDTDDDGVSTITVKKVEEVVEQAVEEPADDVDAWDE